MSMAGTWDNVDDTILGEDDFHDVKDAVSSLTGMWQEFGSGLGLGPAAIKEIKATHSDPVSCLDDVLERWLKEDYNRNKFPSPSWRQLVCAVQSKSGGKNPALAKKIAPRHPKKEKTSENKFGQSSAELHPVIIEPTIPQQVSLRQTQLEEQQPSGLLLQPRNEAPFLNSSKEVNTVVQVTAQEGTVPSLVQINGALLSGKMETVLNLNNEASVSHTCQETAQLHPLSLNPLQMFKVHQWNMGNGQSDCDGTCLRKTGNPSFFSHHDKRSGQIDTDGGKQTHESYDPYSPGRQELELSFRTVSPLLSTQPDAKYDMECIPHGIALIINNEHFKKKNDREGTELDEKNLIETFRYLGYRVEVHRDKKKAEIETIFNDIKALDHSKYDSFVCCLLTHGADGGYIYASDDKKLELNNLISNLNAANCKSLFGKPKLFFIQACRGEGKSLAVSLEPRVDTDSDPPVVLPSETDFFFGYATTPSMVAWRDLDNGSWYVTELCLALCEQSSYADLASMHVVVQRRIAENYESTSKYKQTTECISRLTKKVYFVHDSAS
ncbi:hypothetical protein EMCRGX_G004616 [Ephydatia muelleri]